MISATVENQKRADERIPQLLKVPCKYKTLTVAPILEEIDLEPYLSTGEIVGVSIDGESTPGIFSARPSNYEWYLKIHNCCKKYHVDLNINSIGSKFIKDSKTYHISRELEHIQAEKMSLNLDFNHIYPHGGNKNE